MADLMAGETDSARPPARCWCCGKEHPASALLRLDDHDEVRVCLWCAEYLAKRAHTRRDHMRPSIAGRGRNLLRSVRRTVMDHGWHQFPLFGPVLRWLGRYWP